MIPLFSQNQFDTSKTRDLLPLQCKCCNQKFYKSKKKIIEHLRGKTHKTYDFCTMRCSSSYNRNVTVKCENCNKITIRSKSQFNKSKHHFCSHSCAAKYMNKNKKHGTRRSKLEIWIEEQLSKLYPNLNILFNRRDAINSELDIHIPSLSLAFELNGIFHYEPIYGQKKLSQIQNNDQRKHQACLEASIEICWIDTSSQKYFKPNTAQKYLNIITNIINQKI